MTMNDKTPPPPLMPIAEVMDSGPVIPVIVLHKVAHAVPLARALLSGGIRVLELTMRTAAALDCLRAIRAEVPEAMVGMGTITTAHELEAAMDAGARFGVCPGSTPALRGAVLDSGLPFLLGVMTPSEVMAARDAGFHALKLFPAKQAGGIGMLGALGSVFRDVRFCPTGGIDAASAVEYLKLPNVACVGGSWLAPQNLIEAEDWTAITNLARQASALRKT